MIGPNIIISILESRYRENDMLFEQRAPRPSGGRGGRPKPTRGERIENELKNAEAQAAAHAEKMQELRQLIDSATKSGIKPEKVLPSFVAKHGYKFIETLPGVLPKPGTKARERFDKAVAREIEKMNRESFKKLFGVEPKEAPTTEKPIETPVKETPARETSEPSKSETETPSTPKPEEGRLPLHRIPKTGESKPSKPVDVDVVGRGEGGYKFEMPENQPMVLRFPETQGGSIIIPKQSVVTDPVADWLKANEKRRALEDQNQKRLAIRDNFPLDIYRPPPVRELPPEPREPKPKEKDPTISPDQGTEYSATPFFERGYRIPADVGLMGDIGGMSRLAMRYKIGR